MMYSASKLNKQGDQYTALTYSFSYLEPVVEANEELYFFNS